jgi:hypothetical protein
MPSRLAGERELIPRILAREVLIGNGDIAAAAVVVC